MGTDQNTILWLFAGYVVLLMALSWYAQGKVRTIEDYVLAGRQLGFPLATSTIFATWYGAGTLLTMSDEAAISGLSAALLDPLGAGLCLIIAGLWFARPLWQLNLTTLSDLFKERFGPRAEMLSAVVMIPTYFGWIAVQFVAMAQLLELFCGIPVAWGIALIAGIGTLYTLMGGMWAVTLTDMIQMLILTAGVLVIGWLVLARLDPGGPLAGFNAGMQRLVPEHKVLFPAEDLATLFESLGLLLIGSIGNIPGQDLLQRVFSSRSARVASWSCITAGIGYLALGIIPIFLGVFSAQIVDTTNGQSVVPALAQEVLSGPLFYLFILTVLSVVMSTIDSAILSPATVVAHNILPRYLGPEHDPLVLNRISVLGVAVLSVITAYVGESAYGLLEQAYEMQLVGLFAPLVIALFMTKRNEAALVGTMGLIIILWAAHMLMGWEHIFAPLGLPVPKGVGLVVLFFSFYHVATTSLLRRSTEVA